MDWYKVTLAFSESESKMKPLEQGFRNLFETKGSPAEAALFLARDEQAKSITYYFSPAAMAFSQELVTQRRGEPCDPPSPTLEGLSWVFGDRSGALHPYRNCYPTLPL